jgi:DNA polymerase I-like protein with 3'-5' exonuclease and polymerase domains
LKSFIDGVGTQVLIKKYSTTQYGRKRYFTLPKEIRRKDYQMLNKVKRQGVNHLVQGGSADMIKLYLNNLFYNNPFDVDYEHPDLFRTLLTVHDEGDGEFREDLKDDAYEFIEQCMIDASKPFLNDVPVVYHIEIDKCWRK